jgi:hypothetical protein
MKYRVKYLYQGETYWGSDHATRDEAELEARMTRRNGWHAWVERI